MKMLVLMICGNCDFRYSGRCDNLESPVKYPKRERKACEYFRCSL